jgi:hypothetical protein
LESRKIQRPAGCAGLEVGYIDTGFSRKKPWPLSYSPTTIFNFITTKPRTRIVGGGRLKLYLALTYFFAPKGKVQMVKGDQSERDLRAE